MIRIVLDDEQARQLGKPDEPIELVDRQGRMLGQISVQPASPVDEAYLDEIERRMENDNGIRHTTKEVLDHLKRLDAK